jgi:gas vesicle protein
MNRENLGSNLVFFLVGAAAGAAVALLYAPQDGESTRRMIGEKADEYKGKATEFTSNVTATAKDKWGAATDKIQNLVQRGQDSANASIDGMADKAHASINSMNN